jgi:hypothetical protein
VIVKAKKQLSKALLQGFIIDPFKQGICRIEIANDLDVWRKVLNSRWVSFPDQSSRVFSWA